MLSLTTITCAVLALSSATTAYTPAETYRLLQDANIVPNLLPNFNAAAENFLQDYGNVSTNWGNSFTLPATAQPPRVSFGPDANATNGNATRYTLVMFDPDAPTPQNPNASLIRHWTVANLGPRGANLSDTVTLSPYQPPSPPAGSDPHRYIFALYRQPVGGSAISLFNQSGSIRSFVLAPFVSQNNLTLINANFFRAVRPANGTTTTTNGTSSTGTTGSGGAGTSGTARASGSGSAASPARSGVTANTSMATKTTSSPVGAIAALLATASFFAVMF